VFAANDDSAEVSSNSGQLLERREASLMLVDAFSATQIAAAWFAVGMGRPSGRAGGNCLVRNEDG
jgi:hypothetical protein